MTDEHTSPDLASKAARIITMTDTEVVAMAMIDPGLFRSLAATALTQAKDHTHTHEGDGYED